MTDSKRVKLTKLPNLSIVIPAYCEENRIGTTLDELASFLKRDPFFTQRNVEVIVVAADAPDNTHEIVASKQGLFASAHITFTILKPGPRVGKGRDVQYGMLRAHGKYVMFMDADLATPLHHLQAFHEACERGSDIVVGTRDLFHYRSSRLRNMFSGLGNRLYQLTSGILIEDTQCGFKMFTSEAAQLCFSKLSILGWGFDLEVLAIARANNLAITPIRIDDWEDKPYSTYTERMHHIAIRMVNDFVHIAVRQLTGQYVRRRV